MKLLISVIMVTYNHEKYIEEAINGVLMQEGDFEVELFVANDKSPDKTAEIVDRIKLNHPKGKWIIHLNREQNLGMMPNFVDVLKRCRGKYIAMCDGDDCWTDKHKIQTQLAFMEMNPDYALCFHPVEIINEANVELPYIPFSMIKDEPTTLDLLESHFTPTSSLFFTKIPIPDWLVTCPVGDIPLTLLLSINGKIKLINRKMSAYRFSGSGVASSLKNYLTPESISKQIRMYSNFNKHSSFTFDQAIYKKNFMLIRQFIPSKKMRLRILDTLRPFNTIKIKEIVSILLIPNLYSTYLKVINFNRSNNFLL